MPTANTGTDGRFRAAAPGWRGTAEQAIFLEADDTFVLSEEKSPDEFRWYVFMVKNDTSDAIETVNVMVDEDTITIEDTSGLFSGTKDNANTLNIYWVVADTQYVIQNKLASSASAFVGFYRVI